MVQKEKGYGGKIPMSQEHSIVLESISLSFPHHNSGRFTIFEKMNNLFKKSHQSWFRVINNLDLKVKRGEVIGILGNNGAGKSTLLQLLAGVYKPDFGYVRTEGRIVLLASLGLGFSNELSGRENIYIMGGLLGLNSEYLKEIEDDIVVFSGLGEFIDSPIRTYSSGMRARLGFSIACHSNPDILLIDEVFSVGDQDFRRKSKQKIEDMVRGETTVVVVSHSVSILENICDNIIYMKDGSLVVDDNQHYAISLYTGRA